MIGSIPAGELMSQPRIAYQPALDGLRALAVAAVIAYHFGYGWAQGGFLGVDAFFVLSGFLITSLLLAERSDSGTVSLGDFWARRARRLLPALFVMLTVVCLYSASQVPSIQLDALRGDAFAAIFYVSNWHAIVVRHSYFDLFTNPLPLNHLWSLAIEEQFYLVWPIIVLVLLRLRDGARRPLWIVTIVGILASQVAMSLVYSEADPSRAYYGTEARAHTILIGCLLALILRAAPDLPARAGKTLQAIGVVAFAIVVATFTLGRPTATYFNGGSLAFAVLVACIIAAVIAPESPLRRALAVPPVRYVGRISYGLYLWHWPVIVFVNDSLIGLGSNALNVARLAVTVAITAASFHFIEQPILRGRVRATRVRALLPIGVSVVVVAALVGTAGATSPASTLGRITGGVGYCGSAPAAEVRRAQRELRHLGGIATPLAPSPPIRLAVLGDSRACSLLTGLEVGARPLHATVANGAVLGCGIVAGAISRRYAMVPRPWARGCPSRVNHLVDRVMARDDPNVIVWFSGWEVADLEVGNHDVAFGSPEHRRVILERMETLYERTRAGDRKLVILTVPEDAPSTLLAAPTRAFGHHFVELNQINRDFAARHPGDVAVVDLARFVCPTVQPCPRRQDGIQPRPFDGIHFSAEGSAWAAEWVWRQLLAISPQPTSGASSPHQ